MVNRFSPFICIYLRKTLKLLAFFLRILALQDFYMLVDSHAHLMFPQFQQDLDDLLARARGGGGADCECGDKFGYEPCGYRAC